MKFTVRKATLAALGATLLAGGAAHAQFGQGPQTQAGPVRGASTIVITSAKGTWLQVAEVTAIETGTGLNVTLARNGAHARAHNQYQPGSGAGNAIDAALPPARSFYDHPGIYHSGVEGPGAVLEISLAHPTDLKRLTLYGRTDCCSDRDVYRYDILDQRGRRLQSGVLDAANRDHAATVTFDGSGGHGDHRRRW